MASKAGYLHSLQGLLPQGQAWTRDKSAVLTKVLELLAAELARVDTRIQALHKEADPRTTVEMLTDWETHAGLPDTCTPAGVTYQERIAALVDKITRLGGQSPAFYIGIAERLGYEIELVEYKPFICGYSECGDELNGGDEIRFQWVVRVLGARLTEFYCGVSECGDALGEFDQAEDLECILRLLKPAHTNLILSYEGV
jgi:uncharacterized protein YmfQ (DUF2313 family)